MSKSMTFKVKVKVHILFLLHSDKNILLHIYFITFVLLYKVPIFLYWYIQLISNQ